eukprot:CAMPEP_0174332416 /NCGR_PEP_ID=MMETSP0810-20121108/18284_1 /TAXON_ID=73025 ORGANISM="Eutreptiella gymnastica-like, Strain CCMP1594" /NCGR_SAMPLE_ID=MMETSP0810 /ASSEMBLY_ACC=CAM_ASM_000659 /LENGTH=212 /DNA_ID=CAMNT_0015448819 /DNA_START=35 /DNA_END=673 /DNA_ORIENTATION=-
MAPSTQVQCDLAHREICCPLSPATGSLAVTQPNGTPKGGCCQEDYNAPQIHLTDEDSVSQGAHSVSTQTDLRHPEQDPRDASGPISAGHGPLTRRSVDPSPAHVAGPAQRFDALYPSPAPRTVSKKNSVDGSCQTERRYLKVTTGKVDPEQHLRVLYAPAPLRSTGLAMATATRMSAASTPSSDGKQRERLFLGTQRGAFRFVKPRQHPSSA